MIPKTKLTAEDYHQQPQIPDHLKCGEVYTWQCANELYAVECKLCEDYPLCPLSEFHQHMQIWHTEWQRASPSVDSNNEVIYFTDDEAENQNNLCNNDVASPLRMHEVTLQPFEQVVIEQDIQCNKDDTEEKYFHDENVQVAESAQYQIENKQTQQPININRKTNYLQTLSRKEIIQNEAYLQFETLQTVNGKKINGNKTKDLRNEQTKFFQFPRQQQYYRKNMQKCRNNRRKFENINERIVNKNDMPSNTEDSEPLQHLKKFCSITKSRKNNLLKIKQIKRTLSKIVRDVSKLEESDSADSETSATDYKMYQSNTKSNTLRNSSYFKENSKKNCEYLRYLGKPFNGEKKRKRAEKVTSEQNLKINTKSLRNLRKRFKTETETNSTENEISENKSLTNIRNSFQTKCEKSVTATERNKTKKEITETNELRKFQQDFKATGKIDVTVSDKENGRKEKKISETQKERSDMEDKGSETQREISETENESINNETARQYNINLKYKETNSKTPDKYSLRINKSKVHRNKTTTNPNKINEIPRKENENETKTNSNKTYTTDIYLNEIERNGTKLIGNKNNPNEFVTNHIATEVNKFEKELSKNSTIETNELQQNSTANKNKDKTITNNNLKSSYKNQIILYSYEIPTNENETLKIGNDNEKETYDNGTYNIKYNEYLRKYVEEKTKVDNYLQTRTKYQKKFKRNLTEINESETVTLSKSFIDTKRANEVETNKLQFSDCMQNSLDIRTKVEKFCKRRGTEETQRVENASEALLNESDRKVCENSKGTSNNEMNTANISDYLEKFLETRKNAEDCLKKSATNENETATNEKAILICEQEENKSIEITKKTEIYLRGKETVKHKKVNQIDENKNINDEIYFESLQKSVEIKSKAKEYLKRNERKGIETENLIDQNKERNGVSYMECLQEFVKMREKPETFLKKHRKSKRPPKESEIQSRDASKQSEKYTEYVEEDKFSISNKPLFQNIRKTTKSLRNLAKNYNSSNFVNIKPAHTTEIVAGEANESNKNVSYKSVQENKYPGSTRKKLTKNFKRKQAQKFNETGAGDPGSFRDETRKSSRRKYVEPVTNRNEFKSKLRNYENKTLNLGKGSTRISKRLRCHSKILTKTSSKEKKQFAMERKIDRTNSSKSFSESSDLPESNEISVAVAKTSESEDLCVNEMPRDFPKDNALPTENVNEHCVQKYDKSLMYFELQQKEMFDKSTKQNLVTQFLANKAANIEDISKSNKKCENVEQPSSSKQPNLPLCYPSEDMESLHPPLSSKTDKENFKCYEPQETLNQQHIRHLIELYRQHPRLWDQSHPEFCEPQVCCKSWQRITEQWNELCKRKFTIAEVRIRICTLCQRFVQEKDRLALEGEVDESAKFPYYEQMQFLGQQKSLQKRRELYEQQNGKILEMYQHFPLLWHVGSYKLRNPKERSQAIESINRTLKLFGLHLSSMAIQKRLCSLRKCYRLEKIRHLHAQVEQTPFNSTFRHYERMNFLDKHIDPFVCRICGKIFESLSAFRQHLDAENHGSVVPEESEAESDSDEDTPEIPLEDSISAKTAVFEHNKETCAATDQWNKLKIHELETFALSPNTSQMECASDSENSRDILQRFTPFPSSPTPSGEFSNNSPLYSSENHHAIIQESFDFPNELITDSLHLDDVLIEEIMENVTSSDSLIHQSFNQFINSPADCQSESEDFALSAKNNIIEEVLSTNIIHIENSTLIEHHDIAPVDQASNLLSLQPIAEIVTPHHLYTENSLVKEPPVIVTNEDICIQYTDTNVENFTTDLLRHNENFAVVEHPDIETNAVLENAADQIIEGSNPDHSIKEVTPVKETEKHRIPQTDTENISTRAPLVVKVQCADFTLDLKLSSQSMEISNDSENDLLSSADVAIVPLSDHLIHNMIEVYRKFPQLWNPNHLDFNSRTLRRQAWCALTKEFNTATEQNISWRTLHRKLTDYAKYYKKLVMEHEDYERLQNKWAFYEDFKFLNDVIAVNNELQRSVHHRDNNFKIIATYRNLPQLWDTKHADYSKRDSKQRNIEIMCNKLQEENNLQLTTERLKNRLIELRAQYRTAKKERIKCLKNNEKFSAIGFEYYGALNFLDDHIDPFICDICEMEFKKRTDYKQHVKKAHSQKEASLKFLQNEAAMDNICHVCGTKFTTRSNLKHHIRRHEGIPNHVCTMCPKKFYASYSLKVHIRSHTKECPYTCEKCGMSFVSASKLNQHMKRHLNKKDFQCNFCSKTFFTAFEKEGHERRHLNIRDKICSICGKTFVAGSSYYAHLMLHSDTKRFACDKCDMKFAQYAGLYKHKKRHHT